MARLIASLLVILTALGLAGCDQPEPRAELTVLAGSELETLQPLLPGIERATGIHLNLRYGGTLETTEKIDRGEPADLAWLSQSKYLALTGRGGKRVVAQEKTMLSPVILGIKESAARRWGWIGKADITWRDIADRAARGELRFAMTDPSASNTGFSALLGVAAAFSGSADAIRPEAVDHAALIRFFKGQQLTAGSSGWLADAYLRAEDQLNGIVNYESVLMRLNDGGKLHERLVLVYPKEGIVTADYPLALLDPAKRPEYERLVAYLRSPEFQREMMAQTLNRPVIPQVKPDPRFPAQLLVELPFPNSQATIDQILFAYFDQYRRPSHVFFVLDVSASMEGARLDALKDALTNLTGLDTSLTGRFARFRGREKISVVIFSSQVAAPRLFAIDNPAVDSPVMQGIREFAQSLEAGGQTAVYDAALAAYRGAAAAQRAEPERFYSIVLMTDGERTAGIEGDELLAAIRAMEAADPKARFKIFTVLFGEARNEDMERLSDATGGRAFDGRRSLADAFKAIRGYQ